MDGRTASGETGDWFELLLMAKQNVMVAWSRLEAERTKKSSWIREPVWGMGTGWDPLPS